ncbi:hypothetical protein D3C77_426030 [compost metagenome]
MTGARICGLAADQEHIQPVPQQIVIQAQGLHLEGTRPIEAQIVEKTLGFLHHLADVPVDVAVEDIDQLLVAALQQQAPDGGEQKQQRDGCEQQIVALSAGHLTTSMRIVCQTMLLWMAETSISGWAESGISSQSGPLLRRVSGLSS